MANKTAKSGIKPFFKLLKRKILFSKTKRFLTFFFSKIFLDSVFPIDVIKTSRPIYTVDFDQYRDKVLILDDQELLSIYHIANQG